MAEVGKQDFEQAKAWFDSHAQYGRDEIDKACVAALDQAIAACDVDVEALKRKLLNYFDCKGRDREDAIHAAHITETIDHLARLGLLRTSATGGWQAVPIEPTETMYEAGRLAFHKNFSLDPVMHVWDTMLAAAPQSTDGGRDAG